MPAKCDQCGTPLPAGALAGLCPACLLKAGAATDTISDARQPPFNPPTVAELAAKFPQLEILELIGKGGMGAVYKARQTQLDRIVALKILPPGIGADPAFAERFAREAKALAKLNHPGIVTIYDFGRADGLFYFFMEFVDGMNLRQLLHAGRVSPREALAIVPQICDALQFAHDQGIVHRDIKPENILLDRRGRVKVADFGLAKIVGGESGESPAVAGQSPGTGPILTESGKVMGTPQYMAPEQKERPEAVDHRADIYALGVVFYQMLTGELPGKNLEPPSSKVHIDVRLDEVVLRALEKQPELRFQQASVLKTQVETIVSTAPSPAAAGATTPPAPIRQLSSVQNVVSIIGNVIAGILLLLVGWAAYASGFFFNFLYVFILVMVPLRLAIIVWHSFFGSLELRLWQNPFASGLARHRWQLLNGWLFWVLAALTIEICIVPAQFKPEQLHVVQLLIIGGAATLFVLEMLPGRRVHLVTNLAFALGSFFMISQLALIYWPVSPADGVVLSAPFRGEWLVVHGGQSGLINIHHSYGNQEEALDIERVVDGQERIGPKNQLDSYPSWNETLFAPADGTVTEAENGIEDNRIGEYDIDNAAGNHVVIDIGHGHYVMMAHLKKGSLLVTQGDVVHTGQPIALCGHSGNTSHPHLHIQVQDQPKFTSANIRTFPIFFQNVTCTHGSRQRTDAPFTVRRNDRIISIATNSANRIGESDFIGQEYSRAGDMIQIYSVDRDENHIHVKGHYRLVSADRASLKLYITSSNESGFPEEKEQSAQINRGSGDFELVHPHPVSGMPHVNMYGANGKSLVELYFGTRAEAADARKMNLNGMSAAPSSSHFQQRLERIIKTAPTNSQVTAIDPTTGLPLNAPASGQMQAFDPQTGLPINPRANFHEDTIDPVTGLPIGNGNWSPTLAPGEKPDLQKILDDAKNLMNQHDYDGALQRYRWFYEHEPEYGDSYQNVVRITSAISDWVELGRRYPKARLDLMDIRDRDSLALTNGNGYADLFIDVNAINSAMQNDDATYELFKAIRDQDQQLAGQCYFYVEGLLVARGEYQWCYDHMGDPQSRFDNLRRVFEMDQASQKRMTETQQRTADMIAEMNRKSGRTNVPVFSPPDTSVMIKKGSEDRFVGGVRELIEILVGSSHQPEAEKISSEALDVFNTARLQTAVGDAEQKVDYRQSHQVPAGITTKATYSSFDLPADHPDDRTSPGMINFENVPVEEALKIYGRLSKRTVIHGPLPLASISINIQSSRPLNRIQTLQLFDTVLAENGIAMILSGDDAIKAVPADAMPGEGLPEIDRPWADLPESSSPMIRTVRLKHVRAIETIPILQPLSKLPGAIVCVQSQNMLMLRDYSACIRQQLKLLEALDQPTANPDQSPISQSPDIRYRPSLQLDLQPAVVVETQPAAGATKIPPGDTEIHVRFSKPMLNNSWSWSTAWENSTPEVLGKPRYLEDGRTCVLKVRLEPGKSYGWWLNSDQFNNFRDRDGRPSVPYLLVFQTAKNN